MTGCSALGVMLLATAGFISAQTLDCGPNPELNVNWSSNFKKATLHAVCSSSKTSVSGLGEWGAFSGGQDTSECNQDTLNEDQAEQYVQQEIQNQSAAIVASCGYYACKMSGTSSSIANVATIGEVCSLALSGAKGSQFRDFKIVPSYMPLVVPTPTIRTKVFIANETNGTLKFDRPISNDSGITTISPTGSKFSVGANSGKWITLKIKQPTDSDRPQAEDLAIHLANQVNSQSTIHFALVRSADEFQPPASLGCGQMNPHMIATAYSDRAPGEGFDPKTFQSNSIVAVPTGEKTQLASVAPEYHHNGGGWVTVQMDSSCTQLDSERDHATTILAFTTNTTAQAGWCCSGYGPGGDAATNPEWIDQIQLPGNPAHHKWELTVITQNKLLGSGPQCNIRMDGVQCPLDPNIQKSNKFSLTPGAHQIAVSCSEGRIGSRPGNWNDERSFNEQFNVTLDAIRESK